MSTGPSNVTTTQTASPSPFLQPLFLNAAQAAGSGFGNQFGSPGQSVLTSPLSKSQLRDQRKLRKQANKLGVPFVPNFGPTGVVNPNQGVTPGVDPNNPAAGLPGSDLLGQSADLVGQTLQGDFLDPSSNPFLQQTFDRAADLTQTRLASEFAGSGRNLSAAAPARSQELQTLASGIFGGNFQRERDRQTNAVTQAQGLDPVNQLINRIAGLTPGAGGVTTSRQPVFNDSAGGILGGLGVLAGAF